MSRSAYWRSPVGACLNRPSRTLARCPPRPTSVGRARARFASCNARSIHSSRAASRPESEGVDAAFPQSFNLGCSLRRADVAERAVKLARRSVWAAAGGLAGDRARGTGIPSPAREHMAWRRGGGGQAPNSVAGSRFDWHWEAGGRAAAAGTALGCHADANIRRLLWVPSVDGGLSCDGELRAHSPSCTLLSFLRMNQSQPSGSCPHSSTRRCRTLLLSVSTTLSGPFVPVALRFIIHR
ncbi:hypothetical protein PsYK624_009450 [Phanerochaete sordida]|uniref:Uncharacterized protein n=1 Tax=Phanerochaete sordida TaxID=48140 RepID=A0A9P3FYY2_9APHY|nr:hypothetical protein PsYK624_009450 [Phanerochaete sordida]